MKLQYRVLLSQLPALAALLGLLFFGGATVKRLGEQGGHVLRDNYRSVLAAQRMKDALERLDSAALFLISDRPERAEPLIAEQSLRFEAELAVEEHNLTEPGEDELATALSVAWTDYWETYGRYREAQPDQRDNLYFDQLLPNFQRVHDAADQVLAINQDAIVRKSDEAALAAVRARRAFLGWASLGLLCALGLGLALSRRLVLPLREISRSAAQVGEGRLDVRLPLGQLHELDAVALAFNQMAEKLALYRRASDSELRIAREAAQAAIESLLDPVLVLGLSGDLRACNGAARRLDLHSGASLPGGPLGVAIAAAHAAVLRTGQAQLPADYSSVIVLQSPEGERALLPSATPIFRPTTGDLLGVTVLLADVTRLRRLDTLKGDLVQTVAHELRTPLTSLGMALHLSLDERVSGPLSPSAAELLEAARQDVARMRALVEDLLDLSRIQAGRVALRRESIAPSALLASVAEANEAAAEAASVRLLVEVPPLLPTVLLDLARMQLALSNLVGNAIRHAPPGSAVWLRASAPPGLLRFEVQDAGPGVSPEDRQAIFRAFVRGDDSAGAGLGLYITAEVLAAHGGRVGVQSAERGGALFWAELPIAEEAA